MKVNTVSINQTPIHKVHTNPPRTRLTYRVGILGHRPNHLQSADIPLLEERLKSLLLDIKNAIRAYYYSYKELYNNEIPILRAISPLAEGTDRLFAEKALEQDYHLDCPMPFKQEEYEKDFIAGKALVDDSLYQFRKILDLAEEKKDLSRFELDGCRKRENESYAAVGKIVLNQSDLLIVVWNGKESQDVGGTAFTLRKALTYQIPVIWIHADAPHPWRFIIYDDLNKIVNSPAEADKNESEQKLTEEIKKIVFDTLKPPEYTSPDQKINHDTYLNEKQRSWNFFFVWKFFRDLIGKYKIHIPELTIPPVDSIINPNQLGNQNSSINQIKQRLCYHYSWADYLANLCGDAYRSAYILCYILSAFAVLLALLPLGLLVESIYHYHVEAVCIFSELLVVSLIVWLIFLGRKRCWHDRWIDYRVLAELIRQHRFLWILGGGHPIPKQPIHLRSYGDPHRSWMFWHVFSIARETGLPSIRMDSKFLSEYLKSIQKVINEQLNFHIDASQTYSHIESRLHRYGIILFIATFFSITLHGVQFIMHTEILHAYESWMTIACAGLPSIGAALVGIKYQGEFARISKRSMAMAEHLKRLNSQVTELQKNLEDPTDRLVSNQIINLSLQTSKLMVYEVLDWRIVFSDRPLTAP